MRLQHPGGSCPDDGVPDTNPPVNLTLVPALDDTPPQPRTYLRMIGIVRARSGEPIADATVDWWHPADGVDAFAVPVSPRPDGTVTTCDRGRYDVAAGDPDEHLRVRIRAEGYEELSVRLVPLPGLPAISPPVTRSGRSPLAVRPGPGDAVECWCEFALTRLTDL